MNGLILWQSKYGATRKYVRWLKDATGFATLNVKKATAQSLTPYDTVVLAGGVYASAIAGISFLRRNQQALRGKRVFVFCDGLAIGNKEALELLRSRNLKEGLKDVPLFYGRGRWDLGAMRFADRTLCTLLIKSVLKKPAGERTPSQNALVEAGTRPCDWTDPAFLDPLLDAIGI